MKHLVYLGLGSNLGNRLKNLLRAIELLKPEVLPGKVSSIYETAPWGYKEQPEFLNCVVKAKTNLEPLALLEKLKSIESDLGREPSFRYGPRVIDLDILLYDDQVFSSPLLTIPHPRILERAFVLLPLAEIAGALKHPSAGKTINNLLIGIDKRGIKKYDYKEKDNE
jgi:2-amino-4-hydroxy-6-hydroxymethyldihydropteridine diphosphokinase